MPVSYCMGHSNVTPLWKRQVPVRRLLQFSKASLFRHCSTIFQPAVLADCHRNFPRSAALISIFLAQPKLSNEISLYTFLTLNAKIYAPITLLCTQTWQDLVVNQMAYAHTMLIDYTNVRQWNALSIDNEKLIRGNKETK